MGFGATANSFDYFDGDGSESTDIVLIGRLFCFFGS